jgi:spermidine synthase
MQLETLQEHTTKHFISKGPDRRLYFVFFVVSGFCSLVYEVIWLRLAMASFGLTTALASILISTFMAGLGLGCWGAGMLMRTRDSDHRGVHELRIYSAAEFLVGVSSIVVPYELKSGHMVLQHLSAHIAWQSSQYYALAGLLLGAALLPWCTCMGATFPLLMATIRDTYPLRSERSFSYLYAANVFGALLGTLGSAFVMIELLGFRRTLFMAGSFNFVLAISAFLISVRIASSDAQRKEAVDRAPSVQLYGLSKRAVLWMLFTTGLVSMGLEVVWIRQFTPYLGNVVYAFAGIVAAYLLATFVGSQDYRSWIYFHAVGESASAWSVLALFAVLPVVAADPQLPLHIGPVPLAGLRFSVIVLFCALLGFLTPLLVDSWSSGDPTRAANAYAINVAGCIVGPILAGFFLLPYMGERWATLVLTIPLFAIAALTTFYRPNASGVKIRVKFAAAILVTVVIFAKSHDYESHFPVRRVRRDYTATVTAVGEGFSRLLLVNGYGMTALTPTTKYMAHLPLAFMGRTPRNGLVICFGMGTSFRSMLSWGIPTTAVDLVPSIPTMFDYFHSDADKLSHSPLAKIVVDDGRRFLDGTSEKYDVIVVDPPPPPAAPGSSLLYSREFYEIAKQHLAPDGILQMWYPAQEGDPGSIASVTRALTSSFPYVRAFWSADGWGTHFLASSAPLPGLSESALAARLPAAAARDFLEWGPEPNVAQQFQRVLSREVTPQELLNYDPKAPAVRDDEPINEYYLLRAWFHYYR